MIAPNNNNIDPNLSNKDGYAHRKGDFGYIISNAKWTSENLLLWKKFFDAQLIEQNIENCSSINIINLSYIYPSISSINSLFITI